MVELILIVPFAAVLWIGVIKWVRLLDTRDLLEGIRPTAADVAVIEAGLLKFGDPR